MTSMEIISVYAQGVVQEFEDLILAVFLVAV